MEQGWCDGQALMRRREVERVTGLSRAGIYKKMRLGDFPEPIKIGAYAVAWRVRDVQRWLQDPTAWRAEGQRIPEPEPEPAR
ncbi:prophage regulatory protein [Paraburkholderia sp. GAS448]|uniref:helix-turn-helix transcriptional regulator n=1 Tax=Paraburkholderia sp. GAS448 TaxID=3035136 RepID=UPI003D1AF6BB